MNPAPAAVTFQAKKLTGKFWRSRLKRRLLFSLTCKLLSDLLPSQHYPLTACIREYVFFQGILFRVEKEIQTKATHFREFLCKATPNLTDSASSADKNK